MAAVIETNPKWNSYSGFTSPPTDSLLISYLDGLYCSCRFTFFGFGVDPANVECSFNFDLGFLPDSSGYFGGGIVFLNFNQSLSETAKDFVILLPQPAFTSPTLDISIPKYLNDEEQKLISGTFFYKL